VDEGIYEALHTVRLRDAIAETGLESDYLAVEDADQPHILARHVAAVVQRVLVSVRNPEERIDKANRLIAVLGEGAEGILPPAQQLTRLYTVPVPGVQDRTAIRPATPLSEVALLTNGGRGEPAIGHELKAEIASADRVDLLCAFIKWTGVRLLESELADLAQAGKQLRVITTTYLGSTERKTLDRLVRDYGAEVMVQYDALRTRLHAKAWLFHRNSGFDTAYIGSSNLTSVALVDGVEWNVRASRIITPALLDKFQATFDNYWAEDPAFERYDPDRDAERLDRALAEAGGGSDGGATVLDISGLEVRPYPYQQAMLDDLWAARAAHGWHRNLVVAATGTGKTVLAALDYRHLTEEVGSRPRLLFVAHTIEILRQAMRTYREVLGDGSFGELFVRGGRPVRWQHVFASIQSLTGKDGLPKLAADQFDVVVIDEFHHAAASTYRKVLDHFDPGELLGLTATPERADGVDVRQFFGGRIATELRLWEALGAELLCPFHYFGVADGTDLSGVKWTRGRYDHDELEALYTGNDARVRMVLKAIDDKITSPQDMRALGFCISVAHAEFMAARFAEAGLPAHVVSGSTSDFDRKQTVEDLRAGRINVIFSVDVFNEGLDIREVDTVLMLRPTESATIFLQQLGRGLRRTREKSVLTVLDFVGNQRDEFRWDGRLHALTGRPRGKLASDVEQEFPYLPSGCRINLDRVTQQTVLASLRRQLSIRAPQLVEEVRVVGEDRLSAFLEASGMELPTVIKGNRSWTELARAAGVDKTFPGPIKSEVLKRNRAFAHVDDEVRAVGYRRLLTLDESYEEMSETEQLLAKMLFFSVWPDGGKKRFSNYDEGLRALRAETAASDELSQIVDIAFAESRQLTTPLDGDLADLPLQVHARYSREEILAGLGHASLDKVPSTFREGVKYIPERNIDALFVTLTKTEETFSPTTMYKDYPIGRDQFHWESQSTTTLASPTGQRYVNNTSTVLLFVRETKNYDLGTRPYVFLGRARSISHTGERPVAITWQIDVADAG
jgi:superfamily II DNA or RNA helicase/HKD family nuclease